jgi:ABC-2 type transport system permease protein
MMNRRAIIAIARKDIKSITANIQVWLPMFVIPIFFSVLLPIIVAFAARASKGDIARDMQIILDMLEKLPDSSLRRILDSLETDQQRIAYIMFNYFMSPFFLMIPLMAASTVSVDSFVGEKERGTLEGLLLTPVDIQSIFAAKALAAFLPAIGVSLVSFVLFGVCANVFAWPLFDRIFFPHINWAPLVLLVMPAVSLFAILINVFISARVSTFQAGYQLGAILVLSLVAVMIGQFTGFMLLDVKILLAIGVILAILDYALLRLIVRRLDRSWLFESQAR